MSQKSSLHARVPAEKLERDIRLDTRTHNSAKDKICSVLEGLRGEEGLAAQRVSPFRFPLLLQSPPSRTGLPPQATT
jgi:hypothetical protein